MDKYTVIVEEYIAKSYGLNSRLDCFALKIYDNLECILYIDNTSYWKYPNVKQALRSVEDMVGFSIVKDDKKFLHGFKWKPTVRAMSSNIPYIVYKIVHNEDYKRQYNWLTSYHFPTEPDYQSP